MGMFKKVQRFKGSTFKGSEVQEFRLQGSGFCVADFWLLVLIGFRSQRCMLPDAEAPDSKP
jgi:hypothetical protein